LSTAKSLSACGKAIPIATSHAPGSWGRKKLTAIRRTAQELGWLDPAQPLPQDTVIASRFGRTPHLPSTCVSTLEPFREQIIGWFEADVQGTTIHSALKRNHGYTGSYSAVRRFLKHLGAEVSSPRRRFWTSRRPMPRRATSAPVLHSSTNQAMCSRRGSSS
jgi:hypothetical protein